MQKPLLCEHIWFSDEALKAAKKSSEGDQNISLLQMAIGDKVWQWDICIKCGWPKITQLAGGDSNAT